MWHPWYTCAIFSHWSTSELGSGVKPVLRQSNNSWTDSPPPRAGVLFPPPAYDITHLKLISNRTHAISTDRVAVYRYEESERQQRLGTPCHRQSVATWIQSLQMEGGIWGKGKVLTGDRSKTFPEWNPVQLQWRHLVVQHPNVRGRLSATELPKVVRKSTGLQCREEAWESESAHTYTREGFQAFCLFF